MIYSVWYDLHEPLSEIHVCHSEKAHERFRGAKAAGLLPGYVFEYKPTPEWLEGFGVDFSHSDFESELEIEANDSQKKYLHEILRDRIRATIE